MSEHAVAGRYVGEFDETRVETWAKGLRLSLASEPVSFGIIYMTPTFFEVASQVLDIVRIHARTPVLVGCSTACLVSNGEEAEGEEGISLVLFAIPEVEVKGCHFNQEQVEEGDDVSVWHETTDVTETVNKGWFAFLDPFQIDCERWLRQWDRAYPRKAIVGGLASGDPSQQRTQVYLDGEVFEEGGVALSIGGGARVESVTAQGCTPIGGPWTITKVDENVILEIASRPAYDVLAEMISELSAEDQLKLQGNLFVGLAIDEYAEEFARGDFLVRNVIGADPDNGAIAVGALPRVGQTLQFQRRDKQAASEDLDELLKDAWLRLGSKTLFGGSLHCCNGRGSNLFGAPHHDASLVQKHFADLPVAGFFCNGEFGPVGGVNFIHGYTASLGLLVSDRVEI